MKIILWMSMISIALLACGNKDATVNRMNAEETRTKVGELPEWAKHATIYEVNIRQFTPEGTLKAFESHLDRIANMGVEILWLMPIYPISTTKKKGELGSYYAVSDFTKVNPEFGTKEDVKSVIDKAHELGMKVILDWVPNHTGWDHVWIDSHPEYYTKGADGQITEPINPDNGEPYGWSDVADLNYENEGLRKQMIEDMTYWVEEMHIDGFRYDIAFGVPDDFWLRSRDALLGINPDLFLLAEAENDSHLNDSLFHLSYGWSFHHMLNDIAKGEKNADDVFNWLEEKRQKVGRGMFMLFTSNHDENSWAGTTKERMGDAHRAMAVLVNTFEGIPLMYGGQEEPLDKRLAFFAKDTIGFQHYKEAEFYKKLLLLRANNKALFNGEYGGTVKRLVMNPNIIAFERVKDDNRVVVMINTGKETQQVDLQDIKLPEVIYMKDGVNMKEDQLSIEKYGYLIAHS